MFSLYRARYLVVAAALLAASACAGNRALPSAGFGSNQGMMAIAPDAAVDTTSILKKLVKNVTIGSTVDANNGDKTPHGVVIAPLTNGPLKKGDRLVVTGMDVMELNARLVTAGVRVAAIAAERHSLEETVLAVTIPGSDRVDLDHSAQDGGAR